MGEIECLEHLCINLQVVEQTQLPETVTVNMKHMIFCCYADVWTCVTACSDCVTF